MRMKTNPPIAILIALVQLPKLFCNSHTVKSHLFSEQLFSSINNLTKASSNDFCYTTATHLQHAKQLNPSKLHILCEPLLKTIQTIPQPSFPTRAISCLLTRFIVQTNCQGIPIYPLVHQMIVSLSNFQSLGNQWHKHELKKNYNPSIGSSSLQKLLENEIFFSV